MVDVGVDVVKVDVGIGAAMLTAGIRSSLARCGYGKCQQVHSLLSSLRSGRCWDTGCSGSRSHRSARFWLADFQVETTET